MQTSLSHLSSLQRSQLATITEVICNAVAPEKVILYGDLVSGWELPPFAVGYDVLVITPPADERKDHVIQDIVENRCRFKAPVSVIVHDIRYVNTCLAEGSRFFQQISRDGILLHDAGRTRLIDGDEPDPSVTLYYAREDFARWWARANAFFQGALHIRERGQASAAIFLLHQAAEQAYQAIILTFTGYKPCTHNLDKLRRYTRRFSFILAALFPRDTPDEDHYFKVLASAYVDARYSQDYSITDAEGNLLIQRVAQLLSIAQRICHNQFILLEKLAAQAA